MPAIDRIAVDLKFNRILRSLRQTSPPAFPGEPQGLAAGIESRCPNGPEDDGEATRTRGNGRIATFPTAAGEDWVILSTGPRGTGSQPDGGDR